MTATRGAKASTTRRAGGTAAAKAGLRAAAQAPRAAAGAAGQKAGTSGKTGVARALRTAAAKAGLLAGRGGTGTRAAAKATRTAGARTGAGTAAKATTRTAARTGAGTAAKATTRTAARTGAGIAAKATTRTAARTGTGTAAKAPPRAATAKSALRTATAKSALRTAAAKVRKTPRTKAPPVAEPTLVERVEAERRDWRERELAESAARMPLRRSEFHTDAGIPIPDVLTPADRGAEDYLRDLGFPGRFPFTRGVQPSMYRGRLWTMRQFAGFGTPADTNRRFQYLLEHGVTGLSTAFDMPALMGYDADHPMSRGEVGKEGVAVSSLADFEILFDGIPLDRVTTSMTINASAIYALACYVAVAEKQGVPPERLGGTIQADILKEYIAQKEFIVPPRPAVRMCVDMIEWCADHMPRWNPISISGYHIREAGATAVQELAFTIADGVAYVEECLARGLDVDSFAGRLSFFWDVHNDFFEEVAKFRAARRIWARLMRDRFGAKDPRSWLLRTHAQTAGVSLTAQQPYNNVARTALQAFAAVLGGTQSLHTNSLDETYALPTEEAVTIALRTQQIIAHETGADRVVDPLGGSYYVEYLTDEVEKRALEYLRRIDDLGGMVKAVEEGYPQREIAESAFRHQREIETGDRKIVGVNAFRADREADIPLLKIDDDLAREQMARLEEVRRTRDPERHRAALAAVREACHDGSNLVPPVLEAVKAYATLGEVCDVFREAFGTYREDGSF